MKPTTRKPRQPPIMPGKDINAHNWPAGLSLKQTRAISAVLEMPTVESAMKKAGVSRSIYYAWIRQDKTFRDELNTRRQELYETSLNDLKAVLGEAVAELQRLIAAKDPRVRMAAVKTAMDAAMKAHEQLEVNERLSALEREEKTKGKGR